MRKSKVKIVVQSKYFKDSEDNWIVGTIPIIIKEIAHINYTKKNNFYITIEKIKPNGYYTNVLGVFTIVLSSKELCKMTLRQAAISIFSMPPISTQFDLVELK